VERQFLLGDVVIVLLVSALILAGFFPSQPAVSYQSTNDVDTFNIAKEPSFLFPMNVDPVTAYDASGRELIFNVYDRLAFFSDKRVLPPSTTNVSAYGYSDLSMFEPGLAERMPDISEDRLTWTFSIRSGVRFHPWKAANGSLIADQNLTSEDVEYTFERAMIQDHYGASQSLMFILTGNWSLDVFDDDISTNTIEPLYDPTRGERYVASFIENCVSSSANNVTFHFANLLPKSIILQILGETVGSIVNKAFCIEHGCWNGSFYDGWSTDFRRRPADEYSPLDAYYPAKSRYAQSSPDVPATCGTGPYKLARFENDTIEWTKFDDYWRGWTGKHFSSVVVKEEPYWQTRKTMFLMGDYDYIQVSQSELSDLLVPGQSHVSIPGITLYYAAPKLQANMMCFERDVSSFSPYLPEIGGVPQPHFFEDVHLRRAFAYAVNFTDVFQTTSEDFARLATWWVKGLAPDYENKSLLPYNIDLNTVEMELKAAGVWDEGFRVSLLYAAGHSPNIDRSVYESIRDTIQSLNEKRQGLPPFTLDVIEYPPWRFYDLWQEHYLPTFTLGWIADFADPDDFVRAFMYQRWAGISPLNDTVDNLIDLALRLQDGNERNQTYQMLQYMYWQDAWGIPLFQWTDFVLFKDSVRGWYYNQLQPELYFYDLYKETPENPKLVDLSVV